MAVGLVAVCATVRAKALAVLPAERAIGQGKEHLLAHDIFQTEAALFIIPDFGLGFGDGSFALFGVDAGGAEDEVEVFFDGACDGIEAASAEKFEVAVEVGADADVVDDVAGAAVFFDAFGGALDVKWAGLADVEGVVDGAGRKVFVDVQGDGDEVLRGNQHGSSSIAQSVTGCSADVRRI